MSPRWSWEPASPSRGSRWRQKLRTPAGVSTKAPSIPRPVWLLGWASLFTDAATEMIYPLLPVFLSRVLGASALSLGVIEGVAEGINSLLKVLSGHFSDRWARRRPIVIAGYALSSLARPLIAITST